MWGSKPNKNKSEVFSNRPQNVITIDLGQSDPLVSVGETPVGSGCSRQVLSNKIGSVELESFVESQCNCDEIEEDEEEFDTNRHQQPLVQPGMRKIMMSSNKSFQSESRESCDF